MYHTIHTYIFNTQIYVCIVLYYFTFRNIFDNYPLTSTIAIFYAGTVILPEYSGKIIR